jgi:hypothetical protein
MLQEQSECMDLLLFIQKETLVYDKEVVLMLSDGHSGWPMNVLRI